MLSIARDIRTVVWIRIGAFSKSRVSGTNIRCYQFTLLYKYQTTQSQHPSFALQTTWHTKWTTSARYAHIFRYYSSFVRLFVRTIIPRVYQGAGTIRRLYSSYRCQRLLQQIPVERANVDMYRWN
jgi:hypothetical protein